MGKLARAIKRIPLLFKDDLLEDNREVIEVLVSDFSREMEWALKRENDTIPIHKLKDTFWNLTELVKGKEVCENIRNDILRYHVKELTRKVNMVSTEDRDSIVRLSHRVIELEKQALKAANIQSEELGEMKVSSNEVHHE